MAVGITSCAIIFKSPLMMQASDLIGVVVQGAPWQVAQRMSNTQWVAQIPLGSAGRVQVSVFLLRPCDELFVQQRALAVYARRLPNQLDYEFMAPLYPQAPTTSFLTPAIIGEPSGNDVLEIGISLEPAREVENMSVASQSQLLAKQQHWALGLAEHLYTHVASFPTVAQLQAQALMPESEAVVIPPKALERWLEKLQKKIQNDPHFIEKL